MKKNLEELIGKRQERTFTIDPAKREAAIDEEARTVDLAFASETPIERWFGIEVLRCDANSVMLDRLNAGGALLSDHNSRAQVGAVIPASARADSDRVCRATVKFSQRQAGADEFQDVKDGIRTQVSVGYMVHEYLVDNDTETYTATRLEPLEVSLVSIAADVVGSGVGRDLEAGRSDGPAKETEIADLKARAQKLGLKVTDPTGAKTMPDEDKEKPERAATAGAVVTASEIMELARMLDAPGETMALELARDAIAANKTVPEYRQMIFDKRREREAATKTPAPKVGGDVIELTEREKNLFSITRAINADVNIRMGQKDQECFELEISAEIRKRLGTIDSTYQPKGGVLIPTGVALRGGA